MSAEELFSYDDEYDDDDFDAEDDFGSDDGDEELDEFDEDADFFEDDPLEEEDDMDCGRYHGFVICYPVRFTADLHTGNGQYEKRAVRRKC